MYPTGNNRADALALYLAVAEDDQAAFGLQRSATFKLILLSSVEGGDIVKETQHTFTTRETDWGERPAGPWPAHLDRRAALALAGMCRRPIYQPARPRNSRRCSPLLRTACLMPGIATAPPAVPGFTSYMPLVELRDPARGLLVNDTLRMKARWRAKPAGLPGCAAPLRPACSSAVVACWPAYLPAWPARPSVFWPGWDPLARACTCSKDPQLSASAHSWLPAAWPRCVWRRRWWWRCGRQRTCCTTRARRPATSG